LILLGGYARNSRKKTVHFLTSLRLTGGRLERGSLGICNPPIAVYSALDMDRDFPNIEIFATALSDLRSLGFSERDLGREFGVTGSYIRGIENGSLPNWFLGEKIRKFHARKMRAAKNNRSLSAKSTRKCSRAGVQS
jgi:hypothetical protein